MPGKAVQRRSTPKEPRTEVKSHFASESAELAELESGESSMKAQQQADEMGRGDGANIALLMFLYLLQGIPLGLAGSLPLILQDRHVSYQDQAMFSFVFWPFSLKLIWAPIVDSVFWSKMGRRKSWLVPIQYLIGFFLLYYSFHIQEMMDGGHRPNFKPDIVTLTIVFFMLTLLASIQDIAVDGWALTMLSRHNVGWASTCNAVGQTAGFFLGNAVFMALESKDFSNSYMRPMFDLPPQNYGIVTLSDFMFFWSIVFMVATSLVWLLKKETNQSIHHSENELELNVVDTYKVLWKILKLSNVKHMVAVLLTIKIGFAATDAMTGLELIERGVPKDKLALLAVPMAPIEIILPLVISKFTAGPRPFSVFMRAYLPRLFMGVVMAFVVHITPQLKSGEHEFPLYYYLMIFLVYAIHRVFLYSCFVAQMAFFARISDPAVGGTYMTLLNTLTNLGGNWPSTSVLWLAEYLNYRSCDASGCVVVVDAYYILTGVCTLIGVGWLLWGRKVVNKLQDHPPADWKVIL